MLEWEVSLLVTLISKFLTCWSGETHLTTSKSSFWCVVVGLPLQHVDFDVFGVPAGGGEIFLVTSISMFLTCQSGKILLTMLISTFSTCWGGFPSSSRQFRCFWHSSHARMMPAGREKEPNTSIDRSKIYKHRTELHWGCETWFILCKDLLEGLGKPNKGHVKQFERVDRAKRALFEGFEL